jgi:hypothetical protein
MARIRRILGITQLQERIAQLESENKALREGKAVVMPDGKLAKAELPKKFVAKPRVRSFSQFARRKEAEAWREMCQEAYPTPKD